MSVTPPDDGSLDGCDVDLDDPATNTSDDQIAALVLYADVDFTDPDVVARRQAEWNELLR